MMSLQRVATPFARLGLFYQSILIFFSEICENNASKKVTRTFMAQPPSHVESNFHNLLGRLLGTLPCWRSLSTCFGTTRFVPLRCYGHQNIHSALQIALNKSNPNTNNPECLISKYSSQSKSNLSSDQ